jgi:polygalacturonase
MQRTHRRVSLTAGFLIAAVSHAFAGDIQGARPSAHRQLPNAMHGTMTERPTITVGRADADLVGTDNRVLQSAVDYVAGLGGGTVVIGEGEFLMHDSLHLRDNVAIRGQGAATVLRKSPGSVSVLGLDGDFGEEQVTLADPEGFAVGQGIAVWDRNAGGFHTTVARITGRNGNTFSISEPLMSDCMVTSGAQAATVFPVISGYNIPGVRIEGVTIEGGRDGNVHLDGCRGGGIYLYRCHGAVIRGCTVRHYNGDGFSFQQSNDVTLEKCHSEENSSLGFHPGSGSQRAQVRDCVARANGEDGLFLCWRVKNGIFENNRLEGNGRFGISIGHKDTDNVIRGNHVLANGADGVFFRNESEGMAGHRNAIEGNLIENNGSKEPAAGIRVRGATRDLVFRGNVIRDTRPDGSRRQNVGIRLEEQVGAVATVENQIDAATDIEDRRVAR